jgi:hypothetical protein
MRSAYGIACRWAVDDGGEQVGIVVRRFVDTADGEFLSQGFEELNRLDADYDVAEYPQHTLERVRAALTSIERDVQAASLLVPFAHMLVFDAWVGNGDRHPGNWGVVRSSRTAPRLAPMYDPAACLGAELQDSSVVKLLNGGAKALERYIARCPSGFGDGTRLLAQNDMVAALRMWPEVVAGAGVWLARFRSAMDTIVLPASGLHDGFPDNRIELAVRLLRARLDWLSSRL